MEDELNEELNKVTNLLSFIITQPQSMTSLTGVEKEKIMSMNLLRLKCAKMWCDKMIPQIESKCEKITVDNMNKAFTYIEVNDGVEDA